MIHRHMTIAEFERDYRIEELRDYRDGTPIRATIAKRSGVGTSYVVTVVLPPKNQGNHCTCPAFARARNGSCKHIAAFQEYVLVLFARLEQFQSGGRSEKRLLPVANVSAS